MRKSKDTSKESSGNLSNSAENNETTSNVGCNSTTFESNVDTSFFYTNDKFINSLDNNELYQCLEQKYPGLNSNSTDSVIKKQIVQLLNDIEFVEYILSYYNMTIYEFFGKLYKQYTTIFKGPYLKKIKNTLTGKPYAENSRRKNDY